MTVEQVETMSRPELIAFVDQESSRLKQSFSDMLAECDRRRALSDDPAFHRKCDEYRTEVEAARTRMELALSPRATG